MESAILYTITDADTFVLPELASVALKCGGIAATLTPTFINNALAEFATAGTGRKAVVKVECGEDTTYVYGATVSDLESLQTCCTATLSGVVGLSCEPEDDVEVKDVLGTVLGTVDTPAEFATMWNASAVNQQVGHITPLTGWTFTLVAASGGYIPKLLNVTCIPVEP